MFHSYLNSTKIFSTPLSLLIGRIHRAKKQCAARKQGNQQLQRPYDFLIEDLYSLLDDINSPYGGTPT